MVDTFILDNSRNLHLAKMTYTVLLLLSLILLLLFFVISSCIDIPIIMDNELADYVVIYTQQSSITFNCTAISVPVADIDWYTNDKLIIPSDNKYIITSDKDGEYAISRLTILNISITDTGVYTCNASNNIGYATSNGSLTVHGRHVIIIVD